MEEGIEKIYTDIFQNENFEKKGDFRNQKGRRGNHEPKGSHMRFQYVDRKAPAHQDHQKKQIAVGCPFFKAVILGDSVA